MMRDRNGRELRVKDRVVVFSGSRLIPILARVSTRHEQHSGTDFIAVELTDGSPWFRAVLLEQVESLEPHSSHLDSNRFEIRVGDMVMVTIDRRYRRIRPPTE